MKPFHTIAIPNDDILQGRLRLDVFAVDTWEVCQGRGPEEYRDPDIFLQSTYRLSFKSGAAKPTGSDTTPTARTQ